MPWHLTSLDPKTYHHRFGKSGKKIAGNRKTLGLIWPPSFLLLLLLQSHLHLLTGASFASWCPPWRGSRGSWTRWCGTSPCSCPSRGVVCWPGCRSGVAELGLLVLASVLSSRRWEAAWELSVLVWLEFLGARPASVWSRPQPVVGSFFGAWSELVAETGLVSPPSYFPPLLSLQTRVPPGLVLEPAES